MSHRSLASMAMLAAVAVAVIAVLLLIPSRVVGQPQTSGEKASALPRTSDGKPDLSGVWTNNTLTPLERPKNLGAKEFYTDQEIAELTKRARQGDVGDEGDLGAARHQDLRYDLELYGFDPAKVRF